MDGGGLWSLWEADIVVYMEVDKVAGVAADMVLDMEDDKVADKLDNMVVDMEVF